MSIKYLDLTGVGIEFDTNGTNSTVIPAGTSIGNNDIGVFLVFEEDTTATLYKKLWPLTRGKRVTKVRHKVTEGERVWEIDAVAKK